MRGDVWWVDLDPVVGHEANKRRPAVLVGRSSALRDTIERRTGTVTVVPVTSNTRRVYDFQVFLPAGRVGLPTDSKAQAEQIRTVDVSRLVERCGRLDAELAAGLDEALRLHLDIT